MTFESRYTWSDRVLHRLAFASSGLQVTLADIEEALYKAQLSAISVDRPVFVTALPRAGTTVLLNLLVGTGCFVSHTYRDMPFVLCPMIWHRFAKQFQVSDEARERAHGDGVTVSVDSPEAFEEVVWKHFWPAHYKPDRIVPWDSSDDEEFAAFLKCHLKKIIALRRTDGEFDPRYVSKNNLNIARLGCLPDLLPGTQVVVPFRDPLQHASSLRKQHLSFLERHRNDDFARRYMEAIGHYDFGENFRPVDFDGWLDRERPSDASQLDFWLEYWVAAYRSILSRLSDHVHLLSYRALTTNPKASLEWLASVLELDDPSRLVSQSATLSAPREHDIEMSDVRQHILDMARELNAEMEQRAKF